MLSKQKNIILLMVSGSFLLLWFTAPLFSGRFTWGFDLLKYYSPGFRSAWLVTGLIALSYVWLKGFPSTWQKHWSKAFTLLITIVFSAALYLIFKTKIPLLGDGFLRANEISEGRIFSLTEPLTTISHGLLYRLLTGKAIEPARAVLAYRIISTAAGILATVLFWNFSRKTYGEKGPAVFLLLSSLGLNQIFYGYVESYALFLISVFAFFWSGYEIISDQPDLVKCFVPTLLCSLSISLHSSGLFLVPPLFYLWWKTNRSAVRVVGQMGVLLSLPAAVLIAEYAFSEKNILQYLINELPHNPQLPLWKGFWGYGIISPGHWLDIGNQLLLAVPAAAFLFLALTGKISRGGKDGKKVFLMVATLSGLAFILITDPKLGAARDWDLFAWTGIPLVLLAFHQAVKNETQTRLLEMAAVLSVWLFLPWLGVNASEQRSVARYLDLLRQDKKSSAYGYENIAIYYRRKKMPEKVEWVYSKAVENEPNHPRMLYNYGLAMTGNGDIVRGAEFFAKALLQDSTMAQAWKNLGASFIQLDRPGAAVTALQKSVALDPSASDAWYNLGIALSFSGRWEESDIAFSRAQDNGISKYGRLYFYYYWGEVKLNLKQYSKAAEYLKTAIDAGIQDSVLFDEYQKASSAMNGKTK